MQTSRAILPLESLGELASDFIFRESDYPSQFHHLVRVLRIKSGWKLELLDETSSKKITTVIKSLDGAALSLHIEGESQDKIENPITLVLGLPEFDVLERIVEKATELQLNSLKLFIPEHTQHKNAFDRLNSKLLRLEKIRNAARIQSGSGPLKIEIFPDLPAVLKSIELEKTRLQLRIIASLEPGAANLQEFLHKNHPLERQLKNTDIILVVGPEGDLSFEEYKMCRNSEFVPVSLGRSVLRVETAAIGSAFCLFNHLNQ